jgi:hypothetical protein
MTDFLLETRAGWTLTVHRRDFSGYALARTTGIAEITDARSRRLEMGQNVPSRLTFSLDGHSDSAAYVDELTTDVMAWRYDPATGTRKLMFRGLVTAAEDTVSEQSHTVNFTALDYLGVLNRRFLTGGAPWVGTPGRDQDLLVTDLLSIAQTQTSGSGVSFVPGCRLPLNVRRVNPDGTTRPTMSGQARDRTYTGGSYIGQLITDLGACAPSPPSSAPTSFDVDVQPMADTAGFDYLRVWYPSRGQARSDLALVYGVTVANLTRSVSSVDYGNYVRLIGDNGGDENAPQLYAEQWNADANNVGAVPLGLFQLSDQESDVKVPATLQQHATGRLNTAGLLVPSYTLGLRPGWYRPGYPNIGDTVPLVVQSGRLDVNTTVQVLGLSYDIGDDGQEDVELTVGRPRVDLTALFRKTRRDVDALARR